MKATKPKAEELDFYLMANLRPKFTGLPMTIWVSERGHARHGPQMKVSLQHGPKLDPYEMASVSLTESPAIVEGTLAPKDLQLVQAFIHRNRQTLLAYWGTEIDTAELIGRLKPLPKGV